MLTRFYIYGCDDTLLPKHQLVDIGCFLFIDGQFHRLLILDWFASIEPKHPKLSDMSGEKDIVKEGRCSHCGDYNGNKYQLLPTYICHCV